MEFKATNKHLRGAFPHAGKRFASQAGRLGSGLHKIILHAR
jgi:hypothetical protein